MPMKMNSQFYKSQVKQIRKEGIKKLSIVFFFTLILVYLALQVYYYYKLTDDNHNKFKQ